MDTPNLVEEISERELREKITNKCILVNFFAEWNMHCLMISPIIEELAEKFKDSIEFAKINIEESSGLSKKFNVSSIPTLILFKGGKEAGRMYGSINSEQIEERLVNMVKI